MPSDVSISLLLHEDVADGVSVLTVSSFAVQIIGGKALFISYGTLPNAEKDGNEVVNTALALQDEMQITVVGVL